MSDTRFRRRSITCLLFPSIHIFKKFRKIEVFLGEASIFVYSALPVIVQYRVEPRNYLGKRWANKNSRLNLRERWPEGLMLWHLSRLKLTDVGKYPSNTCLNLRNWLGKVSRMSQQNRYRSSDGREWKRQNSSSMFLQIWRTKNAIWWTTMVFSTSSVSKKIADGEAFFTLQVNYELRVLFSLCSYVFDQTSSV